jgi:acetoacetyl-CoA synthetase
MNSIKVDAEAPLWWSDKLCLDSNLNRYRDWVNTTYSKNFVNYYDLWNWSVNETEQFWESILLFFKVRKYGNYSRVLDRLEMPFNLWFPGLKLNYAENNLRLGKQEYVVLSSDESGNTRRITKYDFEGEAGAIRRFLQDIGVKKGDRIASILPNVPEAMEALYATSSLGAIWSSSSPDFGPKGLLDRFSQISPKVLFAVDGYSYNGKKYGREDVLAEFVEKTGSIENVVLLDSKVLRFRGSESRDFREITSSRSSMEFDPVEFNDPLWILYSSGTTGPPKPIVQSHGGILLEHLKLLGLHYNLRERTRFFWYTTTGWMMWNVLVSSIGLGATAVLYDGSPNYPDNLSLWKMADEQRLSFFGTSAPYITNLMKEKIRVIDKFQLKDLYAIGSTGAPLPPEAFRYVYESIKNDVWLASISGGTDLCTAFLGGCPCSPVYAGELQCLDLGADIHSLDDEGNEILDQMGELVIKKPMPSMPIYFWNDNGDKLRETYFSKYPGIWRHGDWVIITSRKSAVILGRSDSTLKRRGIRIGTAEIYRILDSMEQIKESIVVGVELPGGEYYMPLFVVPRKAENFEALKKDIARKIRENLSPRHVPDEIIMVSQIPNTINGKKMEVPLKKLLMGVPVENALNPGSMANPESLEEFEKIANDIRMKLKLAH